MEFFLNIPISSRLEKFCYTIVANNLTCFATKKNWSKLVKLRTKKVLKRCKHMSVDKPFLPFNKNGALSIYKSHATLHGLGKMPAANTALWSTNVKHEAKIMATDLFTLNVSVQHF